MARKTKDQLLLRSLVIQLTLMRNYINMESLKPRFETLVEYMEHMEENRHSIAFDMEVLRHWEKP